MTPNLLGPALRTLTPLGLITGIVALVAALGLVLGGLGFRWDPLDLSRRRAEASEAVAARARADADARSVEAEGQAGQIARLDASLQTARSLDRATTLAIQDARTADDADQPLATDRADRLRDHDRELCRIAPDLVGCAAAPDPAAAGEPTM
ncbi:hypothetical protein [Brevundimonas subvibrioides]|uniref:hypothetical protein n=1 Tax=Brevundimonas subvibrioides TaxID=74313 RepID=UPI0022B31232|nr:hypothetical protein [Brevundimonas subvibrioides]